MRTLKEHIQKNTKKIHDGELFHKRFYEKNSRVSTVYIVTLRNILFSCSWQLDSFGAKLVPTLNWLGARSVRLPSRVSFVSVLFTVSFSCGPLPREPKITAQQLARACISILSVFVNERVCFWMPAPVEE